MGFEPTVSISSVLPQYYFVLLSSNILQGRELTTTPNQFITRRDMTWLFTALAQPFDYSQALRRVQSDTKVLPVIGFIDLFILFLSLSNSFSPVCLVKLLRLHIITFLRGGSIASVYTFSQQLWSWRGSNPRPNDESNDLTVNVNRQLTKTTYSCY